MRSTPGGRSDMSTTPLLTIDNLTKLSEPYGTKVVFNAGRGIVLGETRQK